MPALKHRFWIGILGLTALAQAPDLDALISEAQRAHQAGEYSRSERLWNDVMARVDQAPGMSAATAAGIFSGAAQNLQAESKYEAAEAQFRRVLDLREHFLPPGDVLIAEALNDLAAVRHCRGDLVEAESLYRRALPMFEAHGKPSTAWAIVLNNLALLLRDQRRLGDAERMARQGIEMALLVAGPYHPAVAAGYADLSAIYQQRGDSVKAIQALDRALAIRQKHAGSNHASLIPLWAAEAEIRFSDGNLDAAEALYRKAISVSARASGPHSIHAGALHNGLGHVLAVRGLTNEAEHNLVRALAIFEKAGDSAHARTISVLNNLGNLACAKRDHKQAIRYLERALRMSEKAFGPSDPDVAATAANLAGAFAAARKFRQAEQLYQRVLDIDSRAGAKPQHLAADLNNLGVFYCAVNRVEEGEKSLKRALALYTESLGPDHIEVAGVLANLAEHYRRRKRPDEAVALYQKAMRIWERHPSYLSRAIAAALEGYAQIMRQQSNFVEAHRAEVQAMRIRTKNALADQARNALIGR